MSQKESKFWLKKAAQNGEVEAMAMLATTNFDTGRWANFAEHTSQIKKVLKAAERGSAEAQRWLATSYAHGEILPLDYEKVVYWDTKAAEQSLPESQHDLGVMWMTGEAGCVDISKSLYWYKRCVNRDHNVVDAEWSFRRIIEIYQGKFGSEYKNEKQAKIWEEKSKSFHDLPFRNHPDWFYN